MTTHGRQRRRPLSILIVDAHPDCRDSLALLLSLVGYHTRLAPDGPSAVRAATEDCPDVVLMELALPGMNGWEACKQIRQVCNSGHTPLLIAVTGLGQERYRRLSREAGFHHLLVKAEDPAQLLELLDAYASMDGGKARG